MKELRVVCELALGLGYSPAQILESVAESSHAQALGEAVQGLAGRRSAPGTTYGIAHEPGELVLAEVGPGAPISTNRSGIRPASKR